MYEINKQGLNNLWLTSAVTAPLLNWLTFRCRVNVKKT